MNREVGVRLQRLSASPTLAPCGLRDSEASLAIALLVCAEQPGPPPFQPESSVTHRHHLLCVLSVEPHRRAGPDRHRSALTEPVRRDEPLAIETPSWRGH
jgi:hypothetical protein